MAFVPKNIEPTSNFELYLSQKHYQHVIQGPDSCKLTFVMLPYETSWCWSCGKATVYKIWSSLMCKKKKRTLKLELKLKQKDLCFFSVRAKIALNKGEKQHWGLIGVSWVSVRLSRLRGNSRNDRTLIRFTAVNHWLCPRPHHQQVPQLIALLAHLYGQEPGSELQAKSWTHSRCSLLACCQVKARFFYVIVSLENV